MWVEIDNEALQSLYNAELMDSLVVFSDNQTAQVSQEVGEQLINHYDDIHKSE